MRVRTVLVLAACAVVVAVGSVWAEKEHTLSPVLHGEKEHTLSRALSPAHGLWTFGLDQGDAAVPRSTLSATSLVPGSTAPPLTVETLGGTFTLHDTPGGTDPPLLAMAVNFEDAFSSCMWSTNSSIDDFLQESPTSTQYLFYSYAATATDAIANAKYLQSRLFARAAALGMLDDWSSRSHFAVEAVQGTGWVAQLLSNWTSPFNQIKLSTTDGAWWFPRLDSQYAWLPWPTYSDQRLIDGGDGCSDFGSDAKGNVVFVQYDVDSPACAYFDIVGRATKAGAESLLLSVGAQQPYINLNCNGTVQCNTALSVSASVVSNATGVAIQRIFSAHPDVNVSIVNNVTSGFYFGVDHRHQLVQMGWEKYPWLRILSWEAQWLEYTIELYNNLTRPAFEIPIFGPSIMKGKPGVEVNVTIPANLTLYQHVELDMALGCPGTVDSECPIWDHTVQLFVCCDGMRGTPLCKQELGRWISPFRRRIGRWLTPVPSYLPLLAGPPGQDSYTCTFDMQTAPWAMPWKPSLTLRFSDPDPTAIVPKTFMPLFTGGAFDASYNNRSAITFTTPEGVRKVSLAAVITGHGDDNNGCGEFCVTSHHFVLNGQEHSIKFSEAGTPLGCAQQVRTGAEPNEHGTWVYGRDGWCDGRDVHPWVWDVTDNLNPVGQNNTISYYGWFQGHTPDPTTGGAYIILFSHLTFYF